MGDLKLDPKYETRERDPLADGGSMRAAKKAHKDEGKLRTPEILNHEGQGHLATTRDDENDRTFWDLGWAEHAIRVGRAELDPASGKAELNGLDVRARASALHGEAARSVSPATTEFVAAAPFVARLGDPTVHGSVLGPGLGSPNVLVGGMPAFRAVVDTHLCPLATPAPHGVGTVAVGAATVLVNGFPIARAGDVIAEAGGGPNPIAFGCLTVMAGPLAPPTAVVTPSVEPPGDGLVTFSNPKARVDGLYAEAQAKAGVVGQEGKANPGARVKGELLAALARAEIEGGVRVRIPGVDKVLQLGGRASIGAGCAGGEAEIEIGLDGRAKIGSKKLAGVRPVCGDAEFQWAIDDDPLEVA